MMRIIRSTDILWLSVIILLGIVRPSQQTVYSCNASASCGCSTNSATVSRIVGGENATAATWNWAVSISMANSYLCGGSIISSSWVITAAHCVDDYTASQITIYAGSIVPWSGTQTRVPSQVIVHSGYDPDTYQNDIALLQLDPPLTMCDRYVGTICLPSVDTSTLLAGEWPPVNTTVVAVGWGRLTESGSLPSTLQQVTVQTVDYRASTCTSSIVDWHDQFCAGVSGGGKDTCQGDSGGPLMMFSPSNQWVLVGITSSGIGCAQVNNSGLYTRVAAYQSWISSNMNGSVSTSTSSGSTTVSSSIQTTISTISFSAIPLHANTVETSFYTISVFIFFNLLFIYFY